MLLGLSGITSLCLADAVQPCSVALTVSMALLWVHPAYQEQTDLWVTGSKQLRQNYSSGVSNPGQLLIHKELQTGTGRLLKVE